MQATKTQTNLRVFAGHTHRIFLDVTTIVQSCRDSSKTDPERGRGGAHSLKAAAESAHPAANKA